MLQEMLAMSSGGGGMPTYDSMDTIHSQKASGGTYTFTAQDGHVYYGDMHDDNSNYKHFQVANGEITVYSESGSGNISISSETVSMQMFAYWYIDLFDLYNA